MIPKSRIFYKKKYKFVGITPANKKRLAIKQTMHGGYDVIEQKYKRKGFSPVYAIYKRKAKKK